MKFYIVDAFTEETFGGNPAGVVILPANRDFLPDEIMIKTAAELRYSETAFIKILNENEFQIRYFTPEAEVDLCGHATIASFKALLIGGYIKDNSSYINHTLAGDLNIEIKDGFVMMDMAEPVKINEINTDHALTELYKIMGLDYAQQKSKGIKLLPQMISTGLPDIMMPVATYEDLNSIKPDFSALSQLSKHYEVVGVHAFAQVPDKDGAYHVRNFAPLYAIDEEAATGTSNGALTYYGYLNGFVKSGDNCRFVQGEKMNRPSVILSQLQVDDAGKCSIKVGGDGVVLAQGEIHI
jgi:PhzF family phenazine biosynthesis protein